MLNFDIPIQYNFNPCMNYFMPFGIGGFCRPSISPINPFNFYPSLVAQQQPVFSVFNSFNSFNLFNIAPFNNYNNSIFCNNFSRPVEVSNTQISGPSTISNTNSISKKSKCYNKAKGEKLAQKIVENLPTDRDPDDPLCAKYVKEAVQDCGLGEYINGNAEYCKYIFRANPNFKEIKSDNFSELPAGSVVVYNAFDKVTYPDGTTGNVGKDGHVLIALGDGRGCSDILEDQIGYSKNAYSFIPV